MIWTSGRLCLCWRWHKSTYRLQGKISADIAGKIDNGQIQTIDAVLTARDLVITGDVLKGDRLTSKTLDVNVKLRGEKQFVNIDAQRASSDWLNATAQDAVPVTKKALDEFLKPDSAYNLKANFDCDIGAVFAQMPHVLKVREGTKITSGRLNGHRRNVHADRARASRDRPT